MTADLKTRGEDRNVKLERRQRSEIEAEDNGNTSLQELTSIHWAIAMQSAEMKDERRTFQ